jgi:hypothetical protein
MKLSVTKDHLRVELGTLEKILAVHGSFDIPIPDIEDVGTDVPAQIWKEIRAPGTFFPGVIKAGTYYSDRGREFWYLVRGKMPLRIELKCHYYKRVILGTEDLTIAEELRKATGSI